MIASYKVERKHVDIDFLNEEELRKIINFDTPIYRFEKNDIFQEYRQRCSKTLACTLV